MKPQDFSLKDLLWWHGDYTERTRAIEEENLRENEQDVKN